MRRTVIFIDNGVTGSIGIIDSEGNSRFMETPIKRMQDYTKAKNIVSRIDTSALGMILDPYSLDPDHVIAYIERPMINPQRWKASMSAIRAHESEQSILDYLMIPYMFVDSKQWQRGLLPSSGKKGVESSTLKKESKDIGLRLFPQHAETIAKHGDADGILGAYAFYNDSNR